MLTKTVFVIGAGASVEFGKSMPVGDVLADSIRQCLTAELKNHRRGGETPIIDSLSYSGFHAQHAEAMKRIRDGITTKESIDDFVDEWKDFPFVADVAKSAISYCIASAEAGTSLAELRTAGVSYGMVGEERPMTGTAPDRAGVLASLRNTWLGCVLRYHNARASRRAFLDALQDTAFVTFNYDRCIEQYLWHHLTTSLAIPHDEAREVLLSVPILHAYGMIGQLPELGGHHPFGENNPRYINGAETRIRTYTESVEGIVSDRIASIIHGAEKLVCLGFAFHEQNLRLLFPTEPENLSEVWGTVLGMRQRRETEVHAYLARFCKAPPQLISTTAGALLADRRDELF
jgi:hypothetical protein